MIESRKNAVLFDLDGTVLNSLPCWMKVIEPEVNSIQNQSRTLVKPLPKRKSEMLKVFGPQLLKIKEYGLSDDEATIFVQSIVGKVMGELANAPIQSGVMELLSELHMLSVSMAIVSTSTNEVIGNHLTRLALTTLFSSIVGRDRVSKPKPDPESILLALDEMKVKPKNAIMVGDAPVDVLAAKRAGITSVLYYPKSHEEYYEFTSDEIVELGPDYIIENINELVKTVTKCQVPNFSRTLSETFCLN